MVPAQSLPSHLGAFSSWGVHTSRCGHSGVPAQRPPLGRGGGGAPRAGRGKGSFPTPVRAVVRPWVSRHVLDMTGKATRCGALIHGSSLHSRFPRFSKARDSSWENTSSLAGEEALLQQTWGCVVGCSLPPMRINRKMAPLWFSKKVSHPLMSLSYNVLSIIMDAFPMSILTVISVGFGRKRRCRVGHMEACHFRYQ